MRLAKVCRRSYTRVVRKARPLQDSAEDASGVVLVHEGPVGPREQPLGLAAAVSERLRSQPRQATLERRGEVRGQIHRARLVGLHVLDLTVVRRGAIDAEGLVLEVDVDRLQREALARPEPPFTSVANSA